MQTNRRIAEARNNHHHFGRASVFHSCTPFSPRSRRNCLSPPKFHPRMALHSRKRKACNRRRADGDSSLNSLQSLRIRVSYSSRHSLPSRKIASDFCLLTLWREQTMKVQVEWEEDHFPFHSLSPSLFRRPPSCLPRHPIGWRCQNGPVACSHGMRRRGGGGNIFSGIIISRAPSSACSLPPSLPRSRS